MPHAAPIDEYTLLCEQCGYTIEGLPSDSACPECGRAIADSLPERRTGSPWQHKRSTSAWWRTCWQVFRHPRRTFRVIRVSHVESDVLLFRNILLAPFFGALPVAALNIHAAVAQYARGEEITGPGNLGEFAKIATVGSIAVAAVSIALWILVGLVMIGLHIFSRLRHWRSTHDAMNAICAHAAFGFVLGGLVMVAATPVGIFSKLLDSDRLGVIAVVMYFIVGPVAGLAAFIILTTIGARQCRYANRPRPAAPSPLPEAPESR